MEANKTYLKKVTKQEIAKHINYLKLLKQTKPVINLLEYWHIRFKKAPLEDNYVFSKRGQKEQKMKV